MVLSRFCFINKLEELGLLIPLGNIDKLYYVYDVDGYYTHYTKDEPEDTTMYTDIEPPQFTSKTRPRFDTHKGEWQLVSK